MSVVCAGVTVTVLFVLQEAQEYASENSLLFMETSAKTAMNVNEIFLAIGVCARTTRHTHAHTMSLPVPSRLSDSQTSPQEQPSVRWRR